MLNARKWVGAATLCAVVVMLVSCEARAAGRAWPMTAQGGLITVNTPHYQIVTEHDAKIAQAIGTHQEALFQELLRRLGRIKPPGAIKRMLIIACRSQKKTMEVAQNKPTGAGGLHAASISAWGFAEDVDRMLSTFRREGTRQAVLQYLDGPGPVWLNVGLQVYFSSAQFKNGKLEVGQAPVFMVRALKTGLKEKTLMPLLPMIGRTYEEWNAAVKSKSPVAAMQVVQAWSMVHYLERGEKGKLQPRFLRYLLEVARGKTAQEAWAICFGSNVAAFEKRWRAYIEALEPTGGLDCRTRIQLITTMAFQAQNRPDIVRDIESLRAAALDGKFGDYTLTQYGAQFKVGDAETIEDLFHCPDDKRKGAPVSYELVYVTQGKPPVVRCLHHPGLVLETDYRDDPDRPNTKVVTVISRPATAEERKKAEEMKQSADK